MRRFLAALGLIALALFLALDASGQTKKKKTRPPVVVSNEPIHEPANAVANLEVHPELQATLFASEKDGITNPTNLDIDHRGRVWICDVKNYRGNNGSRPEGDRIMILEDKDGDGTCDDVKTFYQGRDIDSAMGICVLGNRVIVSATPNVFVFHFDDNDKITKREVLFSKTGQPQHDHSIHSFVFGPDGRLYFNFGNTGHAIYDKNGNAIVDLAGNTVNDSGKPYRQGMIFRMDTPWLEGPVSQQRERPENWPDATKGPGAGVKFETLAWNFRNNYEVCVDSFGSMWQSDNDDDGNRGVRINYVMEFGNYGYVDEMTGAGWQSKRTNMEKEVPERHWHLNDPGVVPTLLLTGAGSPCGITIYEGTLLPKAFHGQMIHADAGPSIVRAYPATRDGAGYKATTVDMLDGNKKNNWFRPADVCVAPDGSLFATDWYDPGVGGHAQRDVDRGRIFRVTPKSFSPGSKNRAGPGGIGYSIPKHDFTSAKGAVQAFKSPNLATRYLAWTTLHGMGSKAEPALLAAWDEETGKANSGATAIRETSDKRLRARLLWLLGQIEGKGPHYVDLGLTTDGADGDADMRIVALRLARQLKLDVVPLVMRRDVLADPRRNVVQGECAIALRHSKSPAAAQAWTEVALRIETATNRWNLEALGIGADGQWDAFLDGYLKEMGRKALGSDHGREIVWRSRAAITPTLFAQVLADEECPPEDVPRFFRAFDFQKPSPQKDAALAKLASIRMRDPARQAQVSYEAIMRLTAFDIKGKPEHAAALNRLLDRTKGTSTFVEVVGKFNVSQRHPELLALAQQQPGEQVGVDAMRILLERDATLVKQAVGAQDVQVALQTVLAISNAAHANANPLLLPIVQDAKADLELRRQATRALTRTKSGAAQLIALAKEKKLSEELKFAAGSGLSAMPWADLRRDAFGLFPFATTKADLPILAISDLAKLKGNAEQGKAIFAKQGTCANCHIVNGEGKEVGPNLSEIGKKLSKEALYESILYPSAGISHNYETWIAETTRGDTVQGILISQTPAEVVLKDKDALLRKFKRSEIDVLAKSPVSLMPADLHRLITTQELTDVVEYMLTLREAKKK